MMKHSTVLAGISMAIVAAACGAETGSGPPSSTASATGTEPSSPGASARHSPGRVDSPIAVGTLAGRIAFSVFTISGNEMLTDIYTVSASGGTAVNLTEGDASGFDPSWSPDGKKIAYRVEPQGSNGEGSDIWLMNSDGSDKMNLTHDGNGNWSPAWSPDGTALALASGGTGNRQHIFVMNIDGTNKREINGAVEGEYPDWSPDGARIAFMAMQPGASGDNPNFDIFSMKTDGSALVQLTDARATDGEPVWAPDGRRIVFQSGRDDCGFSKVPDCGNSGDIGPFHDIYVMNADGSEETRLTADQGYYPTWSPDGQYVLFSKGSLRVIRPDGSGLTLLPISGVSGEIDFADWTN